MKTLDFSPLSQYNYLYSVGFCTHSHLRQIYGKDSMERTSVMSEPLQKQRKHRVVEWLLTRLIILAFVIGCIVSIFSTLSTLDEKRQELIDLQSAIDEVENDNVELERILDSEDIDAYNKLMEKQAIEELNYAYPNELRFYDTSRD